MKVETGLTLLSRLVPRPALWDCVGPGLSPPTNLITNLVVGVGEDMVEVVTNSYLLELISTVTLPPSTRTGVVVGGRGAGLVLVDCDHKLAMSQVAEVLGRKVKKVAETHYKGLPKERRGERITSAEQWDLVRESLARILVMEVFNPDCLEVTLLSLQSVLEENTNISCVILLGLNSFYQQVKLETGVSYSTYMSRLVGMVETGCKGVAEELKVMVIEHNLFGDKSEKEDSDSKVIIENIDEGDGYLIVSGGSQARFTLGEDLRVTWVHNCV